jgi:hypothetical protein
MAGMRGRGAAGGGLFGLLVVIVLLVATTPGQAVYRSTLAVITGLTSHLPQPSTLPASPAGGIEAGPGPTGHYTVQAQPAAGSCHYRWLDRAKGWVLPDSHCTPGATNPKVTQATISTTICRAGYTASIRPSTAVTNREKAANARSYSYTGSFSTAEYDHLISEELGGDPNSALNLFVEPNRPGATGTHNPKDTVENQLHALVCSRKVTLVAAQQAIATNWTTALAVLGHPTGK